MPAIPTTPSASITIACPTNHDPNPYTTTTLRVNGSYSARGTVYVQCWLEYPPGTIHKTAMTPPVNGGSWSVVFTNALTATGSNWADLTAHLFDSSQTTQIASPDAKEIHLKAGGKNCPAPT
jgi:hypothetical protein